MSGLREIVKRESFFALYKGNGAQMVRIFPYAATQFTSFELYKGVSYLYFLRMEKSLEYREIWCMIFEPCPLFCSEVNFEEYILVPQFVCFRSNTSW